VYDEQGSHRAVVSLSSNVNGPQQIARFVTSNYSLKTKNALLSGKSELPSLDRSHLAARHRNWTFGGPRSPSGLRFPPSPILPFCTVALVPSISRRYSPARRSALPTFALWVMLHGLADGLGKYRQQPAQLPQQCNTSKKRIGFHAVNFLSIGTSQPKERRQEPMEIDTQARERVDFSQRHLLFLGLTAGKCVSPPRGCHRGVFDVCF